MQVHELKPQHTLKKKKIVGRGGKKGTYSGRGGKGQTARSGRKLAPIIREIIKRYPKLRGYRRQEFQNDVSIVNLELLEKISGDNDIISPETLMKKGVVFAIKGKNPKVKILGNGTLTKKLIIENCKVSKSAKEAIEKAGGTIK